jgi:hypothetical protein
MLMFSLTVLAIMAMGGAAMMGPQFRYWLIVLVLLFFVIGLGS